MTLDAATLHVAIACAALFSAALLGVIYRLHSEEVAVASWSAGSGLIGAGSILSTMQDAEGFLLAHIPANLFHFAGTALLIYGLQRFFRLRSRPDLLIAAVAIALTVHIYFSIIEPLQWARLTNTAAFMVLLAIWPIVDLQRVRKGDTRPAAITFLLLGFGLQAVTYMLRLLYASEVNPTGLYFDASDFLSELALLQSLITVFILSISFVLLVTERLLDRLRHLATIDELTGLFNRRAFNQLTELELARANRTGQWPALLLLDLDHFKSVNDRFGHQAGDDVLHQFGALVKTHVRSGDIVARMGGEEFAALLPATDLAAARRVAERIRETMAEQAFVADGVPFSITISIGIAVFLPQETLHSATLRADAALYAAKDAGRNQVVTAPPQPFRPSEAPSPSPA